MPVARHSKTAFETVLVDGLLSGGLVRPTDGKADPQMTQWIDAAALKDL